MKRLDHYWYSTNLISLLLLPLSGFYCVVSLIRSKLYKLGILKSYKAPVPVVIVGNITVGGTGKTPLIIELIQQLRVQGKKPGVISRGYGGNASSWPQIVNENAPAQMVGDEPKLIYQRTSCPMVVGPDRQKDIRLLLDQFDCDIVLSDDGLQHYALQRNCEIAVIDSRRMFGNGFCIPSGPLRESVSRLQRVDLVLFNGGTDDQCAFSMQALQCLPVGKTVKCSVDLGSFAGKSVHAIAGIGNPQRFFEMLTRMGVQVICHEFSDHYNYIESDLLFDDDRPVLMTEKDAIKCCDFKLPNHWSVPVDIKLNMMAEQKIRDLIDSLEIQDV